MKQEPDENAEETEVQWAAVISLFGLKLLYQSTVNKICYPAPAPPGIRLG
jgi:hypothetical protein